MTKYPIGTKLLKDDFEGLVIDPDELMAIAPKMILADDVCVKWSKGTSVFASTYDEEWLDENCIIS